MIRLGFEPKTHSLEGCCSIQLSYQTIAFRDCKITQFFIKMNKKYKILFVFASVVKINNLRYFLPLGSWGFDFFMLMTLPINSISFVSTTATYASLSLGISTKP